MTRAEIGQAVPAAYAEFIAREALRQESDGANEIAQPRGVGAPKCLATTHQRVPKPHE